MTIPPPDPALVARFRRDVEALTGPSPGVLGVAVSGGADSLALLLLACAAYGAARASPPLEGEGSGVGLPHAPSLEAATPPQPSPEGEGVSADRPAGRLRAISIDHGLRQEAADECRFVGEVCAKLGVAHDIVAVVVDVRGEGLQAAARAARRKAFGDWCRRHRIAWLMTGHHADDQAETVLMRLARGSGVGGLAGIPTTSVLPFDPDSFPADHRFASASILRPLLGWRREELAAVVSAAGLRPVVDPSNAGARFDRTRVRALLRETDVFDVRRLAQVAENCRQGDDALGWMALTLARSAVRKDADSVTLDLAPLKPWHGELMRRILLDIFRHFDGWPPPRGPQLTRLIGLLHAGRTATLAGIKATPRDGSWTFTRAPPRRGN